MCLCKAVLKQKETEVLKVTQKSTEDFNNNMKPLLK